MRFFNNCKTSEEAKKRYRENCKQFHPDNGGSTEEFQQMQAEFSAIWDKLKNIHMNAEGETYTQETTETADEFMDVIEILIHLSGVETEICGKWIWCSGSTRQHKDILKSMGFHWSRNKEAWYFHSEPYHHRHDREYSLDDIRSMYGSRHFFEQERQEQQLKIARA